MTYYTAYVLNDKKRETLLDIFEPAFSKVLAHHITLIFNAQSDTPIPPIESVEITHFVTDNNGIEALVVSVNGESIREDGSYYHITWSLDPEAALPAYIKNHNNDDTHYNPKHANDLIKLALSDNCPDEFSVTALDCKLPVDTLKGEVLELSETPDAPTPSQPKSPKP